MLSETNPVGGVDKDGSFRLSAVEGKIDWGKDLVYELPHVKRAAMQFFER